MRKFLTTALVALVGAFGVTACGNTGHPIKHTHPVSHSVTYGGRTHSQAFLQQVKHTNLSSTGATFGASSTLAGCDSVTISNCGSISHQALGCYAAGTSFANCPAAKADFPSSQYVSIATHSNNFGKVLDTEPGDATPSQDPGWVRAMWAQGLTEPAIYANLSEMTQSGGVIAQMSAAGIPHCTSMVRSHCYLRWVAAWDGNPAIPAGYDAKQWNSNSQVDFDTFSSVFFATPKPPKPRTICWGKGSTPKSAACLKIEAQAKHDWQQYLAFHKGLRLHQKQLAVVQPYPGYFQQTKKSISVPAYKGPSIGYLNGRISEETKNGNAEKAKYDTLVKQYHG